MQANLHQVDRIIRIVIGIAFNCITFVCGHRLMGLCCWGRYYWQQA